MTDVMEEPQSTPPDDSKNVLKSLTLWMLVASIAAQVAKRYGIEIDTAGLGNDLFSLATALVAGYGRVRADKPLNILGAKK